MSDYTLYELSQNMRTLVERMMDPEDELTDAEFDQLIELDGRLEDKVESYIAVIQEAKTRANGINAEEKRLRKRRRAAENMVDRLKDYVCNELTAMGREVVETDLGKMRVQTHHQPTLEVDGDLDTLPDRFIRTKRSVDKSALKDALEHEDEEAAKHARLGPPSRFIRIY